MGFNGSSPQNRAFGGEMGAFDVGCPPKGRFGGQLTELSDELDGFFDERVHVAVVIDERNHLAVAGEDLLD